MIADNVLEIQETLNISEPEESKLCNNIMFT